MSMVFSFSHFMMEEAHEDPLAFEFCLDKINKMYSFWNLQLTNNPPFEFLDSIDISKLQQTLSNGQPYTLVAHDPGSM